MPSIRLRVEPEFCGPVSLGTVGLIQLVRERLGLSLGEAKACVDRCVFGGETVTLAVPTEEAAAGFVREAAALVSPAAIHAEVVAGRASHAEEVQDGDLQNLPFRPRPLEAGPQNPI